MIRARAIRQLIGWAMLVTFLASIGMCDCHGIAMKLELEQLGYSGTEHGRLDSESTVREDLPITRKPGTLDVGAVSEVLRSPKTLVSQDDCSS